MSAALVRLIAEGPSLPSPYTRLRQAAGVNVLPNTVLRPRGVSVVAPALLAARPARQFPSFGKAVVLVPTLAGLIT